MKHLISCFYFLIIVCLASCNLIQKDNPADTILKGHIGFAVKGPLYLTGYADSIDRFLGRKTVLDTAFIDDKGNYRFVIHSHTPNIYDLKSADSFLLSSIYICPKNKLTIDFKEPFKDPVIDTSKPEGKYNDFRIKLTWKFFKDNDTKQFYYIGANYLTVNQFDTFVQGRKNQMHLFYDQYFKGVKTDPSFEKYALSEIDYQYGIDKMMFLWKHRIKNVDVFPDSSYYKDITTKKYLNNPDAICSPAYYHFLNLYINNIYGEEVVKHPVRPQWEGKPMSPAMEKFNMAVQKLDPPYSNIVICKIVVDDMPAAEFKKLKTGKSQNQIIGALAKWFEDKYRFKVE